MLSVEVLQQVVLGAAHCGAHRVSLLGTGSNSTAQVLAARFLLRDSVCVQIAKVHGMNVA